MSEPKAFPEMSDQEENALKAEFRSICLDDLHYLAKHILNYNRVTDHIHKTMAQDIDTPKYKFKLLLWPRGHFKSTLGTEARSIQKLLRNPNERILITNAKLENARRFLRTIARHFHANSKFRWLWRDWWLDQFSTEYDRQQMKDKLDWVVRDTQDEFTLLRPYAGREASITTGATDASLVSQHYSSILADDLVNRDYVRTQDMVDKSILYFKDLLDLLDPDGALEVIGTRWSHMDLYQWIIEEFGGVASMRVPEGFVDEGILQSANETAEEDKDWMISIQPCYDSKGSPIFPEEFTPKVLANLEKSKGPYEFGSQYLLNPTPDEHQKFREEWINKLDVLPNYSSLTGCMTVDPAISVESDACRSAIAVCGYDEYNRMFFIDGLNERLSEDDFAEAVFEYAVYWRNQFKTFLPVGFEAVGFQKVYVYNLRRMMLERQDFFAIDEIKRGAMSKDDRILRLVPRIKNEFYMPKTIPKKERATGQDYDLVRRFLWEITKFPYAGYKDLTDTMADQLDIVRANSFPSGKSQHSGKDKTREFIHPSVSQDRSRLRPGINKRYDFDMVR